jgi:uncharacterized integral membrane protein
VRTVLIVVALLAAVIFSVQNADVVTIDLFFWTMRASLAIVTASCLAVGAVIGILVVLPRVYRMRASERRLRAQLADLDATAAPTRSTASSTGQSQAIPSK